MKAVLGMEQRTAKVPRRSLATKFILPKRLAITIMPRMTVRDRKGSTIPETRLSHVISVVMETRMRAGRAMCSIISITESFASARKIPVYLAITPNRAKGKTIKILTKMTDGAIEIVISLSNPWRIPRVPVTL